MSKPFPPAPEAPEIQPRQREQHPVLHALVRLLAKQAAREASASAIKESGDDSPR